MWHLLLLVTLIKCISNTHILCNLENSVFSKIPPQTCIHNDWRVNNSIFTRDIFTRGIRKDKIVGHYYPYSTYEIIPLASKGTTLSTSPASSILSPNTITYQRHTFKDPTHAIICNEISCITLPESSIVFYTPQYGEKPCPEKSVLLPLPSSNINIPNHILCFSNKNIFHSYSPSVYKSTLSNPAHHSIRFFALTSPLTKLFYQYEIQGVTKVIQVNLKNSPRVTTNIKHNKDLDLYITEVPSLNEHFSFPRYIDNSFILPYPNSSVKVFSSIRIPSTVYDLVIQSPPNLCRSPPILNMDVIGHPLKPTYSLLSPKLFTSMSSRNTNIHPNPLFPGSGLPSAHPLQSIIKSHPPRKWLVPHTPYVMPHRDYLNFVLPLIKPPSDSPCAPFYKRFVSTGRNFFYSDMEQTLTNISKEELVLMNYSLHSSYYKVSLIDRRKTLDLPPLLAFPLGPISVEEEELLKKVLGSNEVEHIYDSVVYDVDPITLGMYEMTPEERSALPTPTSSDAFRSLRKSTKKKTTGLTTLSISTTRGGTISPIPEVYSPLFDSPTDSSSKKSSVTVGVSKKSSSSLRTGNSSTMPSGSSLNMTFPSLLVEQGERHTRR